MEGTLELNRKNRGDKWDYVYTKYTLFHAPSLGHGWHPMTIAVLERTLALTYLTQS